ncbi:MAG: TonB-dependent receptor plug domain-containing protein [Chthoniobacterales bacterium]
MSILFGVVALCLPVAAQDVDSYSADQLRITGETDAGPALSLYRPDIFSSVDGTTLIHGLPVLTLLDGRRFPISGELGRMGTTALDVMPLAFLTAINVQKHHASTTSGSDATGGVVDLRLNRGYGTFGEVGVFYGRSGGKYGREDFQSYIVGGVGNEHIQITAGASYQESSGHIARPRR